MIVNNGKLIRKRKGVHICTDGSHWDYRTNAIARQRALNLVAYLAKHGQTLNLGGMNPTMSQRQMQELERAMRVVPNAS